MDIQFLLSKRYMPPIMISISIFNFDFDPDFDLDLDYPNIEKRRHQ
jgi:hypothetical protein